MIQDSHFLRFVHALFEHEFTDRERAVLFRVVWYAHRLGRWPLLTRTELCRRAGIRGKDVHVVLDALVRRRCLTIEPGPEGERYLVDLTLGKAVEILTPGDAARLDTAVARANGGGQDRLDLPSEMPSLAALVAEAELQPVEKDFTASVFSNMHAVVEGNGNRVDESSAALAEIVHPIFGGASLPLPSPDFRAGQNLQNPKEKPPPDFRELPAKALAQAEDRRSAQAKALPCPEIGSVELRERRAFGLLTEVQRVCPAGQWPKYREQWRQLIELDPDYVETLLRRLVTERKLRANWPEDQQIRNGAGWMSRIARDEKKAPQRS